MYTLKSSLYFKVEKRLLKKYFKLFESAAKLYHMALDFRSSWISRIAFLKEKFLVKHSDLLYMLKVNILSKRNSFSYDLLESTCTWWRKQESQGILHWISWCLVHFSIQRIYRSSKMYYLITIYLNTNAINVQLSSRYYLTHRFCFPTKHA